MAVGEMSNSEVDYSDLNELDPDCLPQNSCAYYDDTDIPYTQAESMSTQISQFFFSISEVCHKNSTLLMR